MSKPPGFTEDELAKLYDQAIMYSENNMNPFTIAYRCKPWEYWNDILENKERLMEKYVKDHSGHSRNHINGHLKGLFFGINVNYYGLPPTSPYGNIRFKLPAVELLDPEIVNLYFCDFYCHALNRSEKPPHYVTIIVCHKNSESDVFCKQSLIPLPSDNPFLRVGETDDGYQFEVSGDIWIELYYTENIQVDDENLSKVETSGRGQSTPGGISNNPYCDKCNLIEWLKKDTDNESCAASLP